jgi:hypothetical protein
VEDWRLTRSTSSSCARTNIAAIQQFVDGAFAVKEESDSVFILACHAAPAK